MRECLYVCVKRGECVGRPQPILVNIIQCRSEPPDTPLHHHLALYRCTSMFVCLSLICPCGSVFGRDLTYKHSDILMCVCMYICILCGTSCINFLFSSLALCSCPAKPTAGIHLSVNNWNIINNIEPVQQAVLIIWQCS